MNESSFETPGRFKKIRQKPLSMAILAIHDFIETGPFIAGRRAEISLEIRFTSRRPPEIIVPMIQIIIFIMFFCSSVFADDVGVVAIKGTVSAGPAGSLQPVKVGSRIPDGQNVKTGANATVILNYADNSRVKLKENTEIVIHAGKAAEPKGLAVVLGGVFALVTKHPGQSFKVHTPVAVSGVRGTEFFMSYDKSSSKGKPGDAWMCVQEGLVEITENDHPAPVLVKAGFGVVVEHGREIAPPQAYAWTKNLNWNMDPADGEIMDKSNVGEDYRKSLLKNDYE